LAFLPNRITFYYIATSKKEVKDWEVNMEDVLFLIGRILVAVFYLDNARNHFFNLKALSGYASSKGVPMPQLAVLGSGSLLVVAAVTIGLGIHPDVGVAALVLFYAGHNHDA
jgi:uncharacterized membrane protein YphA (DoxX/SURF4 family)